MHIALALRIQRHFACFPCVKIPGMERCIGVDAHGTMCPIGRGHQAQAPLPLLCGKGFLLIAGRNPVLVGKNPYLQEMRGLALRVVELAVGHTGARTHALHLTRSNGDHVAHAVLVDQGTGQHIADDLHVAVAVPGKACPRGNAVLVDDTQVAKPHVTGIVVTRKREAVVRLEPAMVGIAPVL